MFRSTKRASTAGRGAAAPTQPGRGFLLKRGKGNKDFQRRFFVLQGAQLSYFETDDTGRSPKGQVVVASVRHAAKADAPECDDAQIGAAFVYTDPDGMATVVRTEGGADAKVEWLRVLAAATGGDKAPRVKVADYFGSAADAWAENQKRLNVVAASHPRFTSGGGGGDALRRGADVVVAGRLAGEAGFAAEARLDRRPPRVRPRQRRRRLYGRSRPRRGSGVGGRRRKAQRLWRGGGGAGGVRARARPRRLRADLHPAAARRSLRALRAGEHRRGGGRRGGGGGAVRGCAGDCAEGVCSAGEAAARVGEVAGREARRGRPHLC